MVNYNIGSWSDFETRVAAATDYANDDTITITSGFTTAGTDILDIKGATVLGQNNTIFFGGARGGLFNFSAGGTVERLIIDGGGFTPTSNTVGGALFACNNNREQYGTITRCKITNVVIGFLGGGFIGYGGNADKIDGTPFIITRCAGTNITFGSGANYAGGFVGAECRSITIENSYCEITQADTGSELQYVGGLIAKSGESNSTIIIDNCYTHLKSDFNITEGGGLTGRLTAAVYITITDSYVISADDSLVRKKIGDSNSTYVSGLVAECSGTTQITRCYVVADIEGTHPSSCGAFAGQVASGGTATYNQCYHVGTLTNTSGAIGTVLGTATIQDSIIQNSTAVSTGSVTLTRLDQGSEGNTGRLPDGTDQGQTSLSGGTFADNWSTSNWSAVTSPSNSFPILDSFESNIWDGTYNFYTDTPGFGDGQGGGDPHLTTIDGNRYEYHQLGWSRLFSDPTTDLTVNCFIKKS